MRVLAIGTMYPPHALGGYEAVWRSIGADLAAAGHASRVLVTDWRSPEVPTDAVDDADVFRELGWYWRDHTWPRIGWRDRLALERRNAAALDRHLAEFAPDVVTWWPLGGLTLSLVERVHRSALPSVFFVHDYWPRYGPEHDGWTRLWRPRRRRLVASLAERLTGIPTVYDPTRAGRWVFCSEFMRRQAFDGDSGISTDRISVVTPGIDTAVFAAAVPEPESPTFAWRIAYVGRVVEQKGVHTAVEALAELPDGATLEIVGTGDAAYRERLGRMIAVLGLQARVRFTAHLDSDRIVSAYRRADVIVHPAVWHEPWGLVPLEAMAAGRPVVATGRGGSAEFLVDGENCLLFAAEDPGALATRLRQLAGDGALRERLRAGGRRTAEAHTDVRFRRETIEQIQIAADGRTASDGRISS